MLTKFDIDNLNAILAVIYQSYNKPRQNNHDTVYKCYSTTGLLTYIDLQPSFLEIKFIINTVRQ